MQSVDGFKDKRETEHRIFLFFLHSCVIDFLLLLFLIYLFFFIFPSFKFRSILLVLLCWCGVIVIQAINLGTSPLA